MIDLVVVGDFEFSGLYLGRYEKEALEQLGNKRLADQMRQHAKATASELILDWLDKSDIAFANLENTLSEPMPYYHPRPTFYKLRADPSNAEDLKLLGVDVVTLANNHMLDCGESGLFETLQALDNMGIKRVGAGMNLEEALSPAIIQADGQRIAFFGFATAFQTAAAPDRPGVAAIRNKIIYEFESPRLPTTYTPSYAILPTIKELPIEEDVLQAQECIKNVRDKVDFIVVAMHWGPGIIVSDMKEASPTNGQQILAHAIIDSGADLVVGHHPHSTQAIEIYKGKHIFYSLGNFAMQIESDIARSEMFLNEAFMVKVNIEKGTTSKVEILPTRTDKTGLPMITEDYENVIKHLSNISSPLNVSLNSYKQGAIIEPLQK